MAVTCCRVNSSYARASIQDWTTRSGRARPGVRRASSMSRSAAPVEPPRRAQRQPSLRAGRGHRDRPPLVGLAEHVLVRDERAVEEDLSKPLVAVKALKTAHVDSGRPQVDQQVGQPPVPLRRRVGAKQAEQVGAERAPGGPRLLAVQPPAAPLLVSYRAARDRGQVAAGAGLGPALGPQVGRGGHPRQDALLLFRRAELEDTGSEQEDPVLGNPLRPAGPVILGLEDQPFPQRRVAAAKLGRPGDGRPPGVEQGALPFQVRFEPGSGVARWQRPGRHVSRQPGSRHVPECQFLVRPAQVHLSGPGRRNRAAGRPRRRGSAQR